MRLKTAFKKRSSTSIGKGISKYFVKKRFNVILNSTNENNLKVGSEELGFPENVKYVERKAEMMVKLILQKFPLFKVNFDLEVCDSILRVESKNVLIEGNHIFVFVENHGFCIEVLPDLVPGKINRSKLKILKLTTCLCLFLALFLLHGCGSTKKSSCIDESKISNGPCTLDYSPVCGCDSKTYGNACQAERNGVISWKSGECGSDN